MSTIISTVDQLGRLQAKIAKLQAEERELKNVLRGAAQVMAVTELDGRLYKANVITSVRHSVSWKSVAEELDPSPALIARHTSESTTVTVRLNAQPTQLKEVA